MIFQNPMTCLNPVYTVGDQLMEALTCHNKNVTRKEAWDRALQVLQDRVNAEGQITLAEFRDLLNTSRKYSQMLLEAYDDRKYTKMEGEAGDPVRRLTGKLQKMKDGLQSDRF